MEPPEPRAARRGRPPIEEASHDRSQDATLARRSRMRLAQRAHRKKKADMLETERARADRLSKALDRVLDTYADLGRDILALSWAGRPPPDLPLRLRAGAIQMSSIAREARSIAGAPASPDAARMGEWRLPPDALATSPSLRPPEPDAVSALLPTHDLGPMSLVRKSPSLRLPDTDAVSVLLQTRDLSQASLMQRVLRACLERLVSLFDDLDPRGRFPALLLPLQFLGAEMLRADCLGSLAASDLGVVEYSRHPHAAVPLPRMYRVVEGGAGGEPRRPPPLVQRFVRGRTRTTIETGIPALQGEWMEASDVEEYLEERGICFRSARVSGRPLASAAVLATRPGPGAQQQHERTDFSVFGLMPDGSPAPPHGAGPAVRTGVVPLEPAPLPGMAGLCAGYPGLGGDAPPGPRKEICIDLDRLIRTLAVSATCIGSIPGVRREAVDQAIQDALVRIRSEGEPARPIEEPT